MVGNASGKGFRWLCRLAGLLSVALGLMPFLQPSARAHFRQIPSTSSGLRTPKSSETAIAASEQLAGQEVPRTICGTILDETGALIEGARIELSREGQPDQGELSNSAGEFSFNNVIAGPFELTVMFTGFATQTYTGTLRCGEKLSVPPITLVVAAASTNVSVSMSRAEIAEAELNDQGKQRVLGALPNFYVTYDPAAPPLTTKQKFKLAWKATIDPVNFMVTAGTAGMEQSENSFPGYGQGAKGYAKRFAANYADAVTGTFLGGAILPSVFRQDPRYFYRGDGTVRSRLLYALTRSVICKNDEGHWQANYSAIVGGLASAGISNLYHPSDRSATVLTIENTLAGIGTTAVTNVLQEFLFRKLTPHAPNYAPAAP
jgi:hypothetical protein